MPPEKRDRTKVSVKKKPFELGTKVLNKEVSIAKNGVSEASTVKILKTEIDAETCKKFLQELAEIKRKTSKVRLKKNTNNMVMIGTEETFVDVNNKLEGTSTHTNHSTIVRNKGSVSGLPQKTKKVSKLTKSTMQKKKCAVSMFKINTIKGKGKKVLLNTSMEKPKNDAMEVQKIEVENDLYTKEEEPSNMESKPVKSFICTTCLKSFSRKYHLDRHLKLSPCSGNPPPSFLCHICNKKYSRQDNLRDHLKTHTGEANNKKRFICHVCQKAFHGLSLLTIHIRKHTGEKPFQCTYCPKAFPSTGALAKHKRTHTGEKPFQCPECGHRFSLKGTLNRHLRVHTGVRPHKCPYCDKKFIQIGGLKAHLFYHTGENGFKCDECGKAFNRKARLEMHKLYVHVKLRPFECEDCKKAFTRKEDLNRHTVLHTGEKPFSCPTCNKKFAIKPSLKLHLLTHIKEQPRSCHECGRAFIRKDCLLRHIRKRHRHILDSILQDRDVDANFLKSKILSQQELSDNIQELLSLLVEESTLTGFGWPEKSVDEVLEHVIRRCGHTPVSRDQYGFTDRLRENAKLLFTVVIDDNAVKTLLNNQTVDEVILHVLRLAKT